MLILPTLINKNCYVLKTIQFCFYNSFLIVTTIYSLTNIFGKTIHNYFFQCTVCFRIFKFVETMFLGISLIRIWKIRNMYHNIMGTNRLCVGLKVVGGKRIQSPYLSQLFCYFKPKLCVSTLALILQRLVRMRNGH
jgi:hypothetical protein